MKTETKIERTECTCPTCQSWCDHAAGWFLPGEAEEAAKLLGLSFEDFFKQHLTVDYWVGVPTFALRPRTVRESGGDVSRDDPRGTCSFYQNGRCAIHAAKPHECATTKHDVHLPGDWHERTAIAWRTKEHQAQIVKLLGYEPDEPVEPDGNPFGFMF